MARHDDHRKPLKVYNRLWELRRGSGLSREELAKLLGINTRTVGYIEELHGHVPSLELAWRISRVFGVSLEEVFSPAPFKSLPERGRRGVDRLV